MKIAAVRDVKSNALESKRSIVHTSPFSLSLTLVTHVWTLGGSNAHGKSSLPSVLSTPNRCPAAERPSTVVDLGVTGGENNVYFVASPHLEASTQVSPEGELGAYFGIGTGFGGCSATPILRNVR